LNKLVTPSPNLVVDGIYGPKTREAVEAAQKKLGVTVDGWAGEITQGAIQTALSKLWGSAKACLGFTCSSGRNPAVSGQS